MFLNCDYKMKKLKIQTFLVKHWHIKQEYNLAKPIIFYNIQYSNLGISSLHFVD